MAVLIRLLRIAVAGVLAAAAGLFLAVAWKMLAYPHEVVISEGLRGGEKVVRAGVNRMHAGLVVRPVEGK